VRINLSTFTRVDAITMSAGENELYAAAVDSANGFAYFGTETCGTAYVIKVNLSTFTRVGALTLNTPECDLDQFLIDPANGFLYSTTDHGTSGTIIKINLATFTRVGAINVNADELFLRTAVIDVARQRLYTASFNPFPGKIVEVDLGSFARAGGYTLEALHSSGPHGSFIDTAAGYAYFTTNSSPVQIIKVSITPKPKLRLEYGTKSTTCSAIASWQQVGSSTGGGAWKMSGSSYLTDGAPSTDVASGLTNGASTFVAGRSQSTSSQTAEIDIRNDRFTEVEYGIVPTVSAQDGATYCFRLTDEGSSTAMTFGQYAEATLAATYAPTQSNNITLGRLKAGASGSFSLSFALPSTVTGPLVVTFPSGFAVTGAFTGGSCSGGGTIGTFGFTGTTLTAQKTSCSGTVTVSGASVTNPVTPGIYFISWINDAPGGGTVIITADDQLTINAAVDPILTFNVGAQASATACAGTFAGSGGTVPLGTLSTSSVASSDASSVPHICTRVTTNAGNGAVVAVKSLNASLRSTSVPADTIPSVTGTLVPGTQGYGICAGSAGADSGRDTTTPTGATPARSAPFNGASCTSSGHDVGALTTNAQNLWTLASASQNAFFRIYVKAAISSTTPAHNDYTDTLTFTATGTF
jgi:hypothetical protein